MSVTSSKIVSATRVIDSDEHFERALVYVAENAVEAGLCERADDWPWFSGPSDCD